MQLWLPEVCNVYSQYFGGGGSVSLALLRVSWLPIAIDWKTIRLHQKWGFEFGLPFENVFLEVENYLQTQEVAIEAKHSVMDLQNTSQFELWIGLKIQMLVEKGTKELLKQFFENLITLEVTQKRDRCFWDKNLVSVFLQEKDIYFATDGFPIMAFP